MSQDHSTPTSTSLGHVWASLPTGQQLKVPSAPPFEQQLLSAPVCASWIFFIVDLFQNLHKPEQGLTTLLGVLEDTWYLNSCPSESAALCI